MNLKELWIGDEVVLIKSGRIGKFEGIHSSGKARINIQGQMVLSHANNIEIYAAPEEEDILLLFPDETEHVEKSIQIPKWKDTIDLHIDKLAPHMEHNAPATILEFQLRKCKEFLQVAIDKKVTIVHIIHGKGNGVLREAVLHLLKDYSEIRYALPEKNGGSLEVWLY